MFFFIWLGFAAVTSIAAAGKGRSGVGWFFIGLLFGIFALIAVLVLPNLEEERLRFAAEAVRTALDAPEGRQKTCPTCAEMVKYAALKCRYCGHDFTAETAD